MLDIIITVCYMVGALAFLVESSVTLRTKVTLWSGGEEVSRTVPPKLGGPRKCPIPIEEKPDDE